MFSCWQYDAIYLIFAGLLLVATALLTRPGLHKSLDRPVERGFGPPCSLWQAWKLFCSLFWERMLLIGTLVSCAARLSFSNNWSLGDLWMVVAIVAIFPFQEYLTHKYLLHRPPVVIFGYRWESVIALVHRVHHRDPWHMERAINPPIAVVLYAVGLPVIFFPFFEPARALTGIAASWLVLLAYEWTHLLIHTSYAPNNWLFKRIWRNHRLHHFKNEHYWFNVSTYGVDSLLGTAPSPGGLPTSSTCLSLDPSEAFEHERSAHQSVSAN